MTNTQLPDLVGITEIAEMYGVHKQTVNGWRRNSTFPTPWRVLAMGPVWDRNDLVAWRRPDNGDYRLLQEDAVGVPCAHCKGQTRSMVDGDVSNGGSRDVAPGLAGVEIICTRCDKTTYAYFSYSPNRGVTVATNW